MGKRGISVIIPTRNNLGCLKHAVESLRENSLLENELLVYDDGSTDGTKEWLQEQDDLLWSWCREWIGAATGRNILARQASKEYMFMGEDGFYYPPGWDEKLIQVASAYPNAYLVPTRIEHKYGETPEYFDRRTYLLEYAKRTLNSSINYAGTNNFYGHGNTLFKSDWIKGVGCFDEQLNPYGFLMQDLKLRIINKYPEVRAEQVDIPLYHFISKSYSVKDEADYEAKMHAAELHFIKKWGFEPGRQGWEYITRGLPYMGWLIDRKWHQKRGLPQRTFQICIPYQHDWERCYKLKPGDIVVEAGAFWGKYGRFASQRVEPEGRVILIEPNPANIEVIHDVILHLNLSNVITVPYAVWKKEGTRYLNIYDRPENSEIKQVNKDRERIEVPTDTLDNILERTSGAMLRCVDLLCVDVVSSEMELLEGAHEWLSKNLIKNIVIHIYGERKEDAKEILEAYNYKIQDPKKESKSTKGPYYQNKIYATCEK